MGHIRWDRRPPTRRGGSRVPLLARAAGAKASTPAPRPSPAPPPAVRRRPRPRSPSPHPGTAAHGGGWYTLAGSGRINTGFTVRKVANTPHDTGQLLLMNTDNMEVKGPLHRLRDHREQPRDRQWDRRPVLVGRDARRRRRRLEACPGTSAVHRELHRKRRREEGGSGVIRHPGPVHTGGGTTEHPAELDTPAPQGRLQRGLLTGGSARPSPGARVHDGPRGRDVSRRCSIDVSALRVRRAPFR